MALSNDFSLRGLYAALDAQRQARGLSWSQVTKEMHGRSGRNSARGLSASTISGARIRKALEGDGVLQMLHWLDRTPESFVPGHQSSEEFDERLPEIPQGKVLRFDTKMLHAALDARRIDQELTWAQVAKESGVGVSTLTYLSKGGRTAFPQVMRMTGWLGRPAAHFTRASDW
ncbi:MAG: hypothetical protein ABSC76_13525 [Terracidiphilus sp.]